jgi:hypothetical protein
MTAIDGADRAPKVPAVLLAQLLLDAVERAKREFNHHGELLYCGWEKSWEDCVTEERLGDRTIVFLHFNIGARSYCVRRSFKGGRTYVKKDCRPAGDRGLLQEEA